VTSELTTRADALLRRSEASAFERAHGDSERPSVLIIDNDATLSSRVARALHSRGWCARIADDYSQALTLAVHDAPDLLLLDVRSGGESGFTFIQKLSALACKSSIVVWSAYHKVPAQLEALGLDVVQYLAKPADVDDILSAFERARAVPSTA
jgi:two-component system, response regulator RegA